MANNRNPQNDFKYPDELVDRIANVRENKTIDKMSDMAKNSSKGLLLGAIGGYIVHRTKHTPLFISVMGGMLVGGTIGYLFSNNK